MITKPFRRVHKKRDGILSEHATFGLGVAAAKEQAGRSIEDVAIPNADNAAAIYAGAEVKGAAHPEAAEAWLDFMRSPEPLQIFERYGFKPYAAG